MSHHNPDAMSHAIETALQHTRTRLCRKIDDLQAQPDASFTTGWTTLVAATGAAFRHEESVMELVHYAGLAAHRAENARTLSALHHVTPGVDGGDTSVGREVLAALAAIVSSHRYSVVVALVCKPLRNTTPSKQRVRSRGCRYSANNFACP